MFGLSKILEHKKVALLATDGFEESELFETKKALEDVGATVEVISFKFGEIKGWKNGAWSRTITVDKTIDDVTVDDYDSVLLPGGVINADKMRASKDVIKFVSEAIGAGKPIAAICHAPWILIETGYAKGRKMTSWPSLKTDLINADVDWVDEDVVVNNGWITSRMPKDIPAFNKKMIEEFSEVEHAPIAKSRESSVELY